MAKRSVGLLILCWSEIIVSLRILLFTVPVMINKNAAGTLSLGNVEDQFIAILSLTAVLFFAVGIMAVSGHKLWKAAHLLAVVIVLSFTLASAKVSGQSLTADGGYFSLPLFFAVILTVLSGILGRTKKAA